MSYYTYITLREKPQLKEEAAAWFSGKWGVPRDAYIECMDAYLAKETEYGWYLCLDKEKIIGGLGVIENDFHDRKDLTPNVCAVYTEEEYRCRGIAGRLLSMVVEDMRAKGISPLYLITDHTDFYERYGWEFLCMVQGDGDPDMTRMYIHIERNRKRTDPETETKCSSLSAAQTDNRYYRSAALAKDFHNFFL